MSIERMEPRFKQGHTPKAQPRGLRRIGKKAQADRDELAAAKREVLERSRGKCEARIANLCTGYGLHLHHVQRRSQGGTNDAANLLHVCWFCHDRIHSNPEQAIEYGFLVPFGGDAA